MVKVRGGPGGGGGGGGAAGDEVEGGRRRGRALRRRRLEVAKKVRWKKRRLTRVRSASEKRRRGREARDDRDGGSGERCGGWEREAIHGCWDLRERASQGRKKGGK